MVQKTYTTYVLPANGTNNIQTTLATHIAGLTPGDVAELVSVVTQRLPQGNQDNMVVVVAEWTPADDLVALAEKSVSDLSTGGSTQIWVAPFAGKIVKAITLPSGDPGAATALALTVDGGDPATAEITIPNEAAANSVVETTFANNNDVDVGSVITLTSDDGASNAITAKVILILAKAQ